jgi:competence ComEA-like helix-hairpin-helix protein
MFKFDWSEFVTPSLLAKLAELAGVNDLGADQREVSRRLTSILRSTGGLPICEIPFGESERLAIALKLLSEAVNRYFLLAGFERSEPGYYLRKTGGELFEFEIVRTPLVDINTASVQQLEKLPAIGKKIADAIVDERIQNGCFESLESLAQRVNGIGQGAANTLKNAVKFSAPGRGAITTLDFGSEFEANFKALLQLFASENRIGSLLRLLDALAAAAAAHPHPQTQSNQIRRDLLPQRLDLEEVSWLGVLTDGDYYRSLPGLLAGAAVSIFVAMFHMALPEESHPTRKILDELIRAHQRGVVVRVLLDNDRPSDPYRSTVINTPAKTYLEEKGVAVKFDDEQVLLHSKFVVIDSQICVIGSHNWSAGSFFNFDDVSIALSSAKIGAELVNRFDQLWSN